MLKHSRKSVWYANITQKLGSRNKCKQQSYKIQKVVKPDKLIIIIIINRGRKETAENDKIYPQEGTG